MVSISQKIMKRMRSKGRGKWVWTPSDFIDLGTRAAINSAHLPGWAVPIVKSLAEPSVPAQ